MLSAALSPNAQYFGLFLAANTMASFQRIVKQSVPEVDQCLREPLTFLAGLPNTQLDPSASLTDLTESDTPAVKICHSFVMMLNAAYRREGTAMIERVYAAMKGFAQAELQPQHDEWGRMLYIMQAQPMTWIARQAKLQLDFHGDMLPGDIAQLFRALVAGVHFEDRARMLLRELMVARSLPAELRHKETT